MLLFSLCFGGEEFIASLPYLKEYMYIFSGTDLHTFLPLRISGFQSGFSFFYTSCHDRSSRSVTDDPGAAAAVQSESNESPAGSTQS